MRKALVKDTGNSLEDFVEIVRWYRTNCGDRGKDWDFTGGFSNIEFQVYSEKAALTVLMWRSRTAQRAK